LWYAAKSQDSGKLRDQVLWAVRLGRRACDLSQGMVVVRWRGTNTVMERQQQLKRIQSKTVESEEHGRFVTVVKVHESGLRYETKCLKGPFRGVPIMKRPAKTCISVKAT
jgi:hypothetical protein